MDPEALASPDALLAELWDAGGTDLILVAGVPPQLRVDGDLAPLAGSAPLTAEVTAALARELVPPARWTAFEAGAEVDFSFSWRGQARVRGNAYRQRGDAALALRLIPRAIPSFDELRLPASVRDMAALG